MSETPYLTKPPSLDDAKYITIFTVVSGDHQANRRAVKAELFGTLCHVGAHAQAQAQVIAIVGAAAWIKVVTIPYPNAGGVISLQPFCIREVPASVT